MQITEPASFEQTAGLWLHLAVLRQYRDLSLKALALEDHDILNALRWLKGDAKRPSPDGLTP